MVAPRQSELYSAISGGSSSTRLAGAIGFERFAAGVEGKRVRGLSGPGTAGVGREKALETAKAVGGVAVFPVFAKGEVPGKDELSQIKTFGLKIPNRHTTI